MLVQPQLPIARGKSLSRPITHQGAVSLAGWKRHAAAQLANAPLRQRGRVRNNDVGMNFQTDAGAISRLAT